MGFTIYGRTISKVGIIGSGNIGPDIALHFSKALGPCRVPVVVVDILPAALEAGRKKVDKKLSKGVESGAFQPEQCEAISKNIAFTGDYNALKDADFILEAATESPEVKHRIFQQVESLASAQILFCSNSSHMEPKEIFSKVKDKTRCSVVHYFYPAERNLLVEIVPHEKASPHAVKFLMKFYEAIGKVPIQVGSRYGYAIDPIFEGLLEASALLVEKGVASVKEIDAIAMKALKMGVGPFTAHNLTGGNPITQHGLNRMHKELNSWFRSPEILNEHVASGKSWDTPARGEEVSYSEEKYRAVSRRLLGAYFGLVTEILESGITTVGDLDMAIELGLAMAPPFSLMNKLGVDEALRMVMDYSSEYPDFKVPSVLEAQVAFGKPWNIPTVFRRDENGIAVVTIKRPRVLNALNSSVMNQLHSIFTALQNDDAIRGVVITGFGPKAFVAGADINELAQLKTPEEGEAFARKGQEVLNLIENLGKPVICAMNGLALGGGNELAMACHARVACKTPMLAGQPEPNLGIVPGYGGTQRLCRWAGLKKAYPMLRNGKPISSSQALEMNLIQQEAEGDVVEAAIGLLKKVLSGEATLKPIQKNPIPVPENLPDVDIGHLSRRIDQILCKAVLEGARMTLEEGLKHEARSFGECLKTKDMRIGMENFLKHGPKKKAEFVHE